MNELFVYAGQSTSGQIIFLGIGSRSHRRRIRLSEDDALKLAHKLMSYARGGSTEGRILSLTEL